MAGSRGRPRRRPNAARAVRPRRDRVDLAATGSDPYNGVQRASRGRGRAWPGRRFRRDEDDEDRDCRPGGDRRLDRRAIAGCRREAGGLGDGAPPGAARAPWAAVARRKRRAVVADPGQRRRRRPRGPGPDRGRLQGHCARRRCTGVGADDRAADLDPLGDERRSVVVLSRPRPGDGRRAARRASIPAARSAAHCRHSR